MELADRRANVGSQIVDEEARARGIELLKKAFAAQQPAVKG